MNKEPFLSEVLNFSSPEEVVDSFHARGWTDGLPIIPPTEERVRAMVLATGLHAAEVIGVVPPRWAEATVENIAVNAVMAGALPEYMPVIVTALQAVCEPAFGLYSVQATTHPCGILLVVTGPVVDQLGINKGFGVFGPGNRANASIGRAMRLTLINVGGGIPGHGDQSTQGSPGKYSYCIAENEEATPWEPFRISLGFEAGDSTVSVFAAESPHNINDHMCTSSRDVLTTVASVMATTGSNNACCLDSGDVLVVLGPEHAHTISSGNTSKWEVQQFLFENARNTIGQLRKRAMWGMANFPKWVQVDDDATRVPIVGRPEDIHIIVTGGVGKHSSFIPTFGVYKSVTRKIELPLG